MLRATRATPALLLLGALAGCGGGLFFNLDGDDDGDGSAPSVTMAASAASAPANTSITLTAIASDPDGIRSVAFFRLETDNAETLLFDDTAFPYETGTTLPANAAGSVRFLARATDNDGRRADSTPVTVTIR